jgi:hypothetical protein
LKVVSIVSGNRKQMKNGSFFCGGRMQTAPKMYG